MFAVPEKDKWFWQCDIILINQPNTVVGIKNAGSKVLFRVDLAGFEIEQTKPKFVLFSSNLIRLLYNFVYSH